MINIFSYTDFRKFLTDYYEEQKKDNPRFSYRSLTALGGINPGNFSKMLKGERNFTLAARDHALACPENEYKREGIFSGISANFKLFLKRR